MKKTFILIFIVLSISLLMAAHQSSKPQLIRSSGIHRETRETYINQSFEGWWPPAGWNVTPATGEGAWVKHNGSGSSGPGGHVFAGNYAAMFDNSYPFGTEGSLTIPEFDLTNAVDPVIHFYWYNQDPNQNPPKLRIEISTNGVDFTELETINSHLCAYMQWAEYMHPLPLDATHVRLTGISDQSGSATYVDLVAIEDASTTPSPMLNYASVYFGSGQINGSYDPFGEIFTLSNFSGGTLSINAITDLSGTAFSSNFDTSITLDAFESYNFSFSFEPVITGHDSVYFNISTNGGDVGIALTGDSYELPDGMVEIGIGMETGQYLPFLGGNYSYTQSLFLQDEINIPDNHIETLLYYFDGGKAIERNLTIYMGHTAQDTLSDWVNHDDLQVVYSETLCSEAIEGWMEIPLTFPFIYNNTDNLVIAVDDNTGQSTYGADFFGSNNPQTMSIYYKNYSTNPNPASPPAIGTGWSDAKLSTYRPNVRMKFDEPYTVANLLINQTEADYGSTEVGNPVNLLGDCFTISNNGPQPLTISSITNLTDTDFSTTFDTAIQLSYGESYSFGFTYTPAQQGTSSQLFELQTNGGNASISLSGDAYELPDDVEEIGVNTLTETSLPVHAWQTYSLSQTIYPRYELQNTFSQIQSIGYHFDGEESWEQPITVYMGHTTQDSLTDWLPVDQMTQVFDGVLITEENDSWATIQLHVPFDYNGTDNLVITIDKNGTAQRDGIFYCSQEDFSSSLDFSSNSTNPDPFNPPTVGTGYSNAKLTPNFPNIRITFQDTVTSPNAVLNSTSGYYGCIQTGLNSDPLGSSFALINNGGGTLTVSSISGLAGSDFTTTLIPGEVSLTTGESYFFGFSYAPVVGEHDSVYVEIATNGGTVSLSITGDAYELPEHMVEIGTAISSNEYLPFDAGSTYSYGQSLYLQTELSCTVPQINTIQYYYQGNGEFVDDITVYMGHTSASSLNNWLPADSLTQVYSGDFHKPQNDGWIEIQLQTPFIYNNTDNLVIAIDENATGSHYGNFAHCTEATQEMSVYYKNFSNNPNPTNPPAVGTGWNEAKLSTYRPNIRIQFSEIYTQPLLSINRTEAYFGNRETGSTNDPFGMTFSIANSGPELLTVSSITGLENSSFTTTFQPDSVSLALGEVYQFGFSYNPTSVGHEEAVFEIASNGGTQTITLSGDAYHFSGDEIEIGTDSLFTISLPMTTTLLYSYSQSLYHQNELNIDGHEITSIYYHYNGGGIITEDITVFMGHTTDDTLNSWVAYDQLSQVFSGTITTFNNDCWIEVPLDEPFFYNNTDNLVIAVDAESNEQYGWQSRFYVSQTDVNMTATTASNSENIDPTNLPPMNNSTGGIHQVYRPNIRLSTQLAPLPPANPAVSPLGLASWTAPTNAGSENLQHYVIYLDGTEAGTTTDLSWQFTGLTADSSYIAGFASVYDEGQSETVEVSFVFAPDMPSNLAVDPLGHASWDAIATQLRSCSPVSSAKVTGSVTDREFQSYNLYLDDVLVANTNETQWIFSDLTNGQQYTAAVTALFDEGESAEISCEFTFTLAAPNDLQADSATGTISWSAPQVLREGLSQQKDRHSRPANRALTGYHIYLDDELIEDNYTELSYCFSNLEEDQTYVAKLKAVYEEGLSDSVTVTFTYDAVHAGNQVVTVTRLEGNFPNPFNPQTTISFSLKDAGMVELVIYNIKGELVKTLINDNLEADFHTITWNGTDDSNKPVSSGVYFYRMRSTRYAQTHKMLMLK